MTEKDTIEFQRHKETSTKTIVFDKNQWKVLKKTKKYGFDSVLHKWVHYATVQTFEPLSSIGCLKKIERTVYIKRSVLDLNTMRNIDRYFRLIQKISVKDIDTNLYLTSAGNRVFMTDLMDVTAPLQFNHVPEGIEVRNSSEVPLTASETNVLLNQLSDYKVIHKPILCEALLTGEIRLLC